MFILISTCRRENIELPDNMHQPNYMSYTNSYSTPSNSQYSTLLNSSPNHLLQRTSISNSYSNANNYHYATLPPQQHIQDYSKSKLSLNNSQTGQIQRQSSGSSISSHKSYYPLIPTYRQFTPEQQQYHTLNPHQLQPHQQYEHVMTTGLGGVWKQSETGEMIWCNSVANIESSWQGDKIFGSLDRRRNKRIHKKLSPSTEGKSDTLHTYNERVRNVPSKPQVIILR